MIHVWKNGKIDIDLVILYIVYLIHVLNYQNVPYKDIPQICLNNNKNKFSLYKSTFLGKEFWYFYDLVIKFGCYIYSFIYSFYLQDELKQNFKDVFILFL